MLHISTHPPLKEKIGFSHNIAIFRLIGNFNATFTHTVDYKFAAKLLRKLIDGGLINGGGQKCF